MIKLLIIDDSIVARKQLNHIFEADPDISVVGMARNGVEAIDLVSRLQPDVATMDIMMPKLDGIETTRQLMQTRPLPIVIVSANWNEREVEMTFKAIEAGAITLVTKPVGIGHPDYNKMAAALVQTVKTMSEVKMVRRWASRRAKRAPQPRKTIVAQAVKLVAIGVSTGGPPVLQTILSALPADFPAPIMIVQHIVAGFLPGLVNWLRGYSTLPVHIAEHGTRLEAGHIYFAPNNWQMGVTKWGTIALSQADEEHNLKPAASYLFRSAARHYGPKAVGILLTGMGRDGAEALKLLKDRRAVTIVQNKETCVVFGMPAAAIQLGAADYILPPKQIIRTLLALVSKNNPEVR